MATAASWIAALLLPLLRVRPALSQIPAEHAVNLTVFSVGSSHFSPDPVNRDTGDVSGDLYFYLGQFLLPIECKGPLKTWRQHFDCGNLEREEHNLVATKLEMEVDSRWTGYSACNLCNGTDPLKHRPCTPGTYVCDCFGASFVGKPAHCEESRVGQLDTFDFFAPTTPSAQCLQALGATCGHATNCTACIMKNSRHFLHSNCSIKDAFFYCPNPFQTCTRHNPSPPAWACWNENLVRKTHGLWYSMRGEGRCNETSKDGTCSWKVRKSTRIKESCLKNIVMTRVESQSPDCFNACGPRNASSTCWISCFFDTVLGPSARHSTSVPITGMPVKHLEEAWLEAFQPESDGGCARMPPPASSPYGLSLPTELVV